MINELQTKERGNHMALACLWFGKGHPKMSSFLHHFVEDAKTLAENWVRWLTKSKQVVIFKLIDLCCVVDSVARPTMQNTTQYNCYFGCSWCYHPGKLVAGQVKYPVSESQYPDRAEKEMLRHMEKALQDGVSYKGVKGPSPLLNVPLFNIVWGFTPDHMHCTLFLV